MLAQASSDAEPTSSSLELVQRTIPAVPVRSREESLNQDEKP